MIGGQAASGEVARANPSREVILAAGSFVGIGSMNLMVLAQEVNNQRERMTSYVIEAMLDDDAVKPAFDTRKLRALKGPIKFRPSVEDDGDELTDAGADPDEARRAAEFCQDAAKRLPVPLHIWGGTPSTPWPSATSSPRWWWSTSPTARPPAAGRWPTSR
jgi:hypothetical protein